MISEEQMERAENEFRLAAEQALEAARAAERALADAQYHRRPGVVHSVVIEPLATAYREADYAAESCAWVLGLIRRDRARLASGAAIRKVQDAANELSDNLAKPGNGLLGLGQ